MKEKTLQTKKALCISLLFLLLYVVGTLNALAQETTLPTVTTAAVTRSGDDVVSGGNVVNDGGSTVTARGICYGNNPNPDLSASFTHTENGTGTGSFTSVISTSATGTIYVRAYATNANGTAYGDELSVNVDYYRLPRFEYNGLTYVVAPDPQSSSTEFISYYSASSYCDNLTAYGYSDWVMPTISELETMWQYRTSIGGFNSYTYMCYHSSTYKNSSTGHYKLVWATGQNVADSNLENLGYATVSSGGVNYTFRCHVRPIRIEIFLPTVTTDSVTNITQYAAVFGGNVTDDGGATVTERGICWSTTPNPTISGTHSNSGTGTGSYTITYSSLTPDTQYYVRAYATNAVGTSYGNQVSFTTPPFGNPTVTTNSVFDITTTTAKGGGNVLDNGGSLLMEKGICWSTSHNPTTYNSHLSIDVSGSSWNQFGSYTLHMTDLIPGTQYYVRAYATNSEGTAYGNEVSFITTSPPAVTTNNVTNITYNSATCGGDVTAEGSGTVTARGVCWSTSPNPTTSNSHTNNGTGTGSFTSNLTGLDQGTLYYVRAYATNSEGTAYGEEISFTTIYTHTVTTNNVSYITQTSATCGGYVTIYSGTTVTERGVCWSTSNQSPTLSDSHASSGSGSGIFSSNLNGLTQNTTYYVRAYATSSEGTVYGETKQFTTTKFEYRISEGGVVATSAGGYFYDSGGPNYSYDNNEQYTMTFVSNQGAGTKIQMMFTYFDLCDDNLVIYDGMNTSSPQIGTFNYSSSPGTVTATNSDGALTFVFISNNSCYGPGWKAAISIVGQSYSYTINTSANPSNGGTVTGGGSYTQGSYCTLTASANTGYTFVNWTENGNQVSTNSTYTFSVMESHTLVANFQQQIVDENITFADANVKALCVANWDTNGDGELSYDEAASVTDLGEVFRNNSTITSFNELQYFTGLTAIGVKAFYYCTKLTSVALPNTVTSIGTQAFYSCEKLVSASLPPSILTIDHYAFAFCTVLTTVEIPAATTYVYNDAYYYCRGLEQILVAAGNTVYDSRNNCNALINSETNTLIFGCKNTLIPNTATAIESKAFYACSGLTSVTIPNSVVSIGAYAFYDCNNLASITISNSVMSIGNFAFDGCSALTSIMIPGSVSSIGYSVIGDCGNLAQVSVDNGNTVYDSRDNCNAIIETSSNKLVAGCKNTIIPNTVTAIGNRAFYACEGITSMPIPNSVVGIQEYAFAFSYITSMEIPTSVTSIGSYAFYYCNRLASITSLAVVPPVLGSNAFLNVNKSIPVYVPAGTTSAYQTASGWSEFTNYQEIESPSYTISVTANPGNGGTVRGEGTYIQGVSCTITATANEGYTFIDWTENGSQVSTNSIYTFSVTSDRTLVANFEEESFDNHWEYDETAYAGNMTVTAVIQIDGIEQFRTDLELGAFCGDECRGTMRPTDEYYDPEWMPHYYLFLTVHGDNGDQITFRLYDHSLNQELDLECANILTFTDNAMIGDIEPPYAINFRNAITQTTNFRSGWNWWSSYVDLSDINGLALLEEGLGEAGVQIKSQSKFVINYGTTWLGGLNAINNEQTLKVQTNAPVTVDLTSKPVSPADHPLTLNAGWNWIGYPCTNSMSLTQAFANYTPSNGDQVKTQSSYAIYRAGIGWMGALQTLTPGNGLFFYTSTGGTLVFSDGSRNTNAELAENITADNNHWVPDMSAYPSNMTVTAVVELEDVELQSERYELAAFANGEVRGSARLMYVEPMDRYMAFLTVTGDEAANLTFGLYDTETGAECLESDDLLVFTADAMVGELESPMVVSFRGTTGLNDLERSLQVYPNPVKRGERAILTLPVDAKAQVEVVNALGVVVETSRATSVQAPASPGVYTLRITVDGKGTISRKLVVR